MAEVKPIEVKFTINFDIPLWSAIKLRIAGKYVTSLVKEHIVDTMESAVKEEPQKTPKKKTK